MAHKLTDFSSSLIFTPPSPIQSIHTLSLWWIIFSYICPSCRPRPLNLPVGWTAVPLHRRKLGLGSSTGKLQCTIVAPTTNLPFSSHRHQRTVRCGCELVQRKRSIKVMSSGSIYAALLSRESIHFPEVCGCVVKQPSPDGAKWRKQPTSNNAATWWTWELKEKAECRHGLSVVEETK